MTEQQMECATWLMMEYEANFERLNAQGLALLLDLRTEWNIEKAKETMLVEVE